MWVSPMKLEDLIDDFKMTWQLMQPYRSAVNVVKTKLESIDDELKCMNGNSPIHTIQSRIKSPESIVDKIKRKGYPQELESLEKLNDIAGLRVVCHYMNDIQYVSQLLIMHEDIQLIRKENYIEYPKDSGYRSLHLVVLVPVHLQSGTVDIPVEIQMRTIAMDFWASLEHELLYKNHEQLSKDMRLRLKQCADQMAETDLEMQKIYQELHKSL